MPGIACRNESSKACDGDAHTSEVGHSLLPRLYVAHFAAAQQFFSCGAVIDANGVPASAVAAVSAYRCVGVRPIVSLLPTCPQGAVGRLLSS